MIPFVALVVKDGSVIHLHIRLKVWHLIYKFRWTYYLIISMEALWEINASAILGEIKYGRHGTTAMVIST